MFEFDQRHRTNGRIIGVHALLLYVDRVCQKVNNGAANTHKMYRAQKIVESVR